MSGRHDGLHTLGRWTSDRALTTPERIAIDDRGVTLNYRELDRRAEALATALLEAGYGPGARIATLAGNSSDQVVLFFACAKAGFVLAPLSWRLAAGELASQVAGADPALWVIEDEFAVLAQAALEQVLKRPPLAAMGPGGVESTVPAPAHVPLEADAPLVRRPVQDDAGLLMLFTSGTEGSAKAVVLTHANCFWNNMALSRTLDLTSHDTVLSVLPQFHVGGWNIQPLLAWWTGATVVLERTFDTSRVLQLISERRVTMMMGVPTHYRMLATHPAYAATDLSTLRLAVVGGAPMPAGLLRCWHARGVSLVQGYGLTEAGPNVLCLVGEDAMRKVGYAGKPYPHVEVRIIDVVSGKPLEGAGRGELVVTGPSIFQGYFRDPEATARVLVDGWLHTGDLVERDAEGYIKVVDRIKDIYISGGENISPTEVEQALEAHPAVADVAVLGVPDPQWGEVGEAYVVLQAGTHADASELAEHCAQRLARFKIPARFHFVPTLPRAGLEKVSRVRLRAFHMGSAATQTQTGTKP